MTQPPGRPCPFAAEYGLLCPQGMVLEEDFWNPATQDWDLPEPIRSYRCQDCDTRVQPDGTVVWSPLPIPRPVADSGPYTRSQ